MRAEDEVAEEQSRSQSGAGRLAAENLDLRLRLVETRERMATICADRFTHPQIAARTLHYERRPFDPLEDQRNRRLLRDHLDMCRAVASSFPWRALELAARPFHRDPVNPATKITSGGVEAIADPIEVRRLLDESGEYLARVLGSRRWRWLQGLRGLLGRRW